MISAQSKIAAQLMVSLTGSSQNKFLRDQDSHEGQGHVYGGGPGELRGHDATEGRPARLRKPNVKYLAHKYDLSSIRTRSRRSVRRAM